MKCYKCGVELGQEFAVCPVCGTTVPRASSPAANNVLAALKDKLFLAICILLSISCGASVLGGGGFPITTILAMIFLWITYSKGRDGFVDVRSMRWVSGTVYAEYIITNVVAILLAVLGVLMGALVSLVGTSKELMDAYMQGINLNLYGSPINITETIAVGLGWMVAGLLIFIGAIILVINLFAWKKLHGFVKSVYVGVQNGGATPVINAKIAKTWLWVFGIFSAVGAFSSLFDFFALVSSGCVAAAYIVGAVLVDRYFVSVRTVEQVNQYGEY